MIARVGEIVQKSAPVNDVVTTINEQLDAGVDLLEGLLVKKAGLTDAVGLVEGLYAGRGCGRASGASRRARRSRRRASARSTREGTLTLARLGREAPIAAGNPAGPALRDVERGSLAARQLYPEIRQTRPDALPRSPVIGTDAPVQYEQRDDIGAPRKRLPGHGLRREELRADTRVIRVRARDQRRGRDRIAAEARPGGARHRGRAQPAADDEAPAREPAST